MLELIVVKKIIPIHLVLIISITASKPSILEQFKEKPLKDKKTMYIRVCTGKSVNLVMPSKTYHCLGKNINQVEDIKVGSVKSVGVE